MKQSLSRRVSRLEAHEKPRKLCQCARTFDYRAALDALAGKVPDDACPVCGLSRGWIPIEVYAGYTDDVDLTV